MTEFDKLRVFFNLIGLGNTVVLDLNSNRVITIFKNGQIIFRVIEKVEDDVFLHYINLNNGLELKEILAKDLVRDLMLNIH